MTRERITSSDIHVVFAGSAVQFNESDRGLRAAKRGAKRTDEESAVTAEIDKAEIAQKLGARMTPQSRNGFRSPPEPRYRPPAQFSDGTASLQRGWRWRSVPFARRKL